MAMVGMVCDGYDLRSNLRFKRKDFDDDDALAPIYSFSKKIRLDHEEVSSGNASEIPEVFSDLEGPKLLVTEVSQDDTKAIVLYNPRNSEESSVPAFQVNADFLSFSKVGRFSRRYMNWGLLDPPSEYSVSVDGDNNLALVPWVPSTSVSEGARGAETAHYENGGKLVIEDITDSLAEDQNQNDEEMEGMEVEEAMPQSSVTGPCFSSYVNQERNSLQAFPSQNHLGFFPFQAVHQGQDNLGHFPGQNNSGIYPAQSVSQGQNNLGLFSTNQPSQGFPFGGCNFPTWQNSNIVNPAYSQTWST